VSRLPDRHQPYHELLGALREAGCALCRLAARAASRYLAGLSWESINDPGIRTRLRASGGFCPPHAREFLRGPNRLGAAILYEDLLREAAAGLPARSRSRRRRPLPACPACEAAREQEADSLEVLAAAFDDALLAAAYGAAGGLCLPHTLALCDRLGEPARRRLVAAEQSHLQALGAELREFIRKHDYRARGEAWGDERSSPPRAVAKMVGEAADPLA
jgi:hypothetical protein